MKACHRCGREWVSDKKQPSVKDFCDGCTAYLHCCLNCRFHDKRVHNECRIPTTEWVADRAGCNFCDEFEFTDRDPKTKDGDAEEKARKSVHDLFGDADEKPAPKGAEGFKKLFGD